MTTYVLGVDVSNWQGNDISGWLDGRDFCFVKITEGQHTVDSGWSGRISQARDAGVVVGAYHFARPENPVSGDASNFITTYGPALKPGDLIALDWESTGGLSNSASTAWKDGWISRVQEAFPNNLVGLYCNTDYWLHHDVSSEYGDFLWIASYGTSDPGIEADWKIWQYTSDPVDTSKAKFSTRAEMADWALSKDTGDDDGDGGGNVPSQMWTSIPVDGAADTVIATGPRTVIATLWLTLTATQGSEIQGRFYLTDAETGERVYTFPIAERLATLGKSFPDFSLPARLDDGEELRFEAKVYDYDAATVDVTSCTVAALGWD